MSTPHTAGDKPIPKYPIGSVDRVLRLILLLGQEKHLGVSEIAERFSIGTSTAHRLLGMVQLYGFAEQDPITKRYRAGPTLVDVGLKAVASADLRHQIRPYLAQLAHDVGETAHVVTLRGVNCIFLDAVESSHAVISSARVGISLPAYATSGGKAMLAELPLQTFRSLYPDPTLPRLTKRTITSRAALEHEMEEIRRRGFAINIGESEDGIGAVAAVLRNGLDEVVGAITATAPAARFQSRDITRFSEAVMRIAASWRKDAYRMLSR